MLELFVAVAPNAGGAYTVLLLRLVVVEEGRAAEGESR
jgi:hypothetical protein